VEMGRETGLGETVLRTLIEKRKTTSDQLRGGGAREWTGPEKRGRR